MTVNDYTLRALKNLSPTWLSAIFPGLEFRAAVLFHHQFDHSIEALVNGTTQILAHCKISLDSLDSMASTLSVIHDITSRERIMLINERDELQDAFWTMLGGNKGRLRGLGQQLILMGGVANYRARALKHVQQTMDGVLNIREDISHIRTEVAVVDRPASRITVSYMELQLYSIAAGMARIAERMEDTRRKNQILDKSAKLDWGNSRDDTEMV